MGEYGRNSDGRALKESAFGKALRSGQLGIPDSKPLPGEHTNFSYFFAADEAFPLTPNIMKRYPKRNLTNKKRIFNARLSKGRKSVKCAFSMLTSKFRILETPINCNTKQVDDIVQALCVLHNFIRKREGVRSTPAMDCQTPPNNNQQPHLTNQNRATNLALTLRDQLTISDFL